MTFTIVAGKNRGSSDGSSEWTPEKRSDEPEETDRRVELELEEIKTITEMDEEYGVKARGSFSMWRKMADRSVKIRAKVVDYDCRDKEDGRRAEKAEIETFTTILYVTEMNNRVDGTETAKINAVTMDTEIHRKHGYKMAEITLEREAKKGEATERADGRKEVDPFTGRDELDGALCYQLYQKMRAAIKREKLYGGLSNADGKTRWMMERTKIHEAIETNKPKEATQQRDDEGARSQRELREPMGAHQRFNECTMRKGESYKDFANRLQGIWDTVRHKGRDLGTKPDTSVVTRATANPEDGSPLRVMKEDMAGTSWDEAHQDALEGGATTTRDKGKTEKKLSAKEESGTNPPKDAQGARKRIKRAEIQEREEPDGTPRAWPSDGKHRTKTDENQNPSTAEKGATESGSELGHH